MALTTTHFYFGLMFAVGIIAVGLMLIGQDFYNSSDINLNNKSKEYIEDFTGIVTESGINNLYSQNSANLKSENLLGDDNSSSIDLGSGEVGVRNEDKNRATRSLNFFKLIYNIPSFILKGLNLDIEPWRNYINIGTYIFVIALIILLWRVFMK